MRRVDVFFYGLFMDEQLLRQKGLRPESVEIAAVADLTLRIGQRASLDTAPGGRVHGVVMSLTMAELEQFYSEPSVQQNTSWRFTERSAGSSSREGFIVATRQSRPTAGIWQGRP